MSQIFLREIEKIKAQLVYLFKMVEMNYTLSCRSLNEGDMAAAQEVFRREREIDDKKIDIQEECFKIVALHQPVAFDLRFLMATLKFNNDLERIADLAASIANRAQILNKMPPVDLPFDVDSMSNHVHSMLTRSLDALINLDQDLAKAVLNDEEAVNEIHRSNLQAIKKLIVKNQENIDALLNYLAVSRYMERIAEYVTNLSEEVVYIIEGEIIQHPHQDK
ncbi:phosphate signaling complex protein PhoU [Desulfobulbus alkaliphilus]|uniref:phosphate signaling complex protein PhoU n=1 Tax=Desulfobulbus alkaliphilus TaxID=869814 RepID=UPI0019647144|nr:phosphate signaling complex protein PhoU [Desulfobulbus alkaliphilus]MBM9536560.1 phosphate signaling complex protein PhoU [Desulfobulbus alkaliphilus]